jgi:hypothetical protein
MKNRSNMSSLLTYIWAVCNYVAVKAVKVDLWLPNVSFSLPSKGEREELKGGGGDDESSYTVMSLHWWWL